MQGAPITVITDHAPLIGIENNEITERTSTRILRIKERWQSFNITIQYVKGEDNIAADALSRHIEGIKVEENEEESEDTNKAEEEGCVNCVNTITEEASNRIKELFKEN